MGVYGIWVKEWARQGRPVLKDRLGTGTSRTVWLAHWLDSGFHQAFKKKAGGCPPSY